MEILLGLAAIGGLALLLQSKSALPSDSDFKKANEKLAITPDDGDANTVSGKYTAFVLGDYQTAMPLLSKSSDKTLKSLADHELDPQYSLTAAQKIGMGDEWVVAAKSFKPIYRSFYERASQWYALAWPDVDGVWKDKLRERAKKLLAVPGSAGASKVGAPEGWAADGKKIFVDSAIAHRGGKSVRIDGGKDKNAQGSSGIASALIVAPKGKVILSAWVATDGTEGVNDHVVLSYFGVNGNFITTSGPFIPVDSPFWKRVEATFDIPADVARVSVGVISNSTKGSIWVDDVSLKFDGKEILDNGSFEK